MSEWWADPCEWAAQPENQQEWNRRAPSRYYCPQCGEVGHGFHSPVRGWVVESHTRCLPAEGRHDYYYKQCPGGRIDPKKDKAP